MNTKQKLQLITQNTQEVIGEDELKNLLADNEKIKHYIGFEISGKIHLGTGILSMKKVKDFQDAGVEVSVFLADWHAWINNKLGGDKEIIRQIGVGYFKEGLKKCFELVGGDSKKLKFVLGSELYHKNDEYWQTFVDISKSLTLSRVMKSSTIMGRSQGESMPFAWLLYPPMQVADIFIQDLKLIHSGMDQRKAHVIAREVATKLKYSPLKNKHGKIIKPIAVHHPLILGLNKPDKWPFKDKSGLQDILSTMKMSKSKPDSAVFIDDDAKDIRRKINKAFCPEGEVNFNPVLDWTKNIIFANIDDGVAIKREEKYGGNVSYKNYTELEKDFKTKKLYPTDLKMFVADWLVEFLAPIRQHFSSGSAKKMKEELEKIL